MTGTVAPTPAGHTGQHRLNWHLIGWLSALFLGSGLAIWRIIYLFATVPPHLGGWLLVMGLTMGLLYVLTGFGITLGYHRGFTHGSFKYPSWLRNLLLVGGGMALEGDALTWVRTHRTHHAYADEWDDPHSPYLYAEAYPAGEPGVTRWRWWGRAIGRERVTWGGLLKGLLWSHLLWMLVRRQPPERVPSVRDLERHRAFRLQRQYYWALVAATFGLPTLIGAGYGLLAVGGWSGLFWGVADGLLVPGVLRICSLLNFTWSINSICHVIGRKVKDAEGSTYEMDLARDVSWLGVPTFGESYHAGHHADPTAADHGTRRTDVDLTKWLIWLLERFGVVWDVKWHKPDRVFSRAQRTLPSLTKPEPDQSDDQEAA